MDKIINKHIDKLEVIQEGIDSAVEKALKEISIDTLVVNPHAELNRIKELLQELFVNNYSTEAIEEGLNFAKVIQDKIEEDKTLKVDKSKDPNLND